MAAAGTHAIHKHAFFGSMAIYIGTAVGAGIFSIPYAMAQFGFFPSLFYLLLLTAVNILINLFYGEVVLRTGNDCQMAGYAGKYIGQWGKRIGFLVLISANYGAMLVYAVGVGQFLFELLGPYLGGSPFAYSLAFFAIMSAIIFRGLKAISGVEMGMSALFIAIVAFLAIIGGPSVHWDNFSAFHPQNFFLPYGVILFAIGAVSVIPLMKKTMDFNHQLRNFKKSIVISSLITFAIYLTFAFVVIGITGEKTSPEGIVGLSGILGKKVLVIGSIFGFLTMATSFLTLGLVLRHLYEFDYKIPRLWAWLLTCIVPLLIFLLGLPGFIQLIGIIGAIIGGLRGILVIMMWQRAKRRGDRQPEYSLRLPLLIPILLYLVFFAGLIYQAAYSLGG